MLSVSRDAYELAIHTQARIHKYLVDEGASLTIDSNLLRTEDADDGPANLIYTIESPPVYGLLTVGGIPLAAGGIFSQQDIDNNLLVYSHDGVDRTPDGFDFGVSDGGDPALGTVSIDITGFTGTLVQLPLDEGSGVLAADVSGNGFDGTLINGAVFEANTGDGSPFAVRFDGNNDLIDLGFLDADGTGLSLTAWFNAASFSGGASAARMISKASGTQADDHVFMLGTVNVGAAIRLRARVRHGGSTTTLVASSGDLQTGIWYHAALTDDGSIMRLYLNGVEVGSSPAPGLVDIAPALSVAVGGQPLGAGTNYFNGLIDDIRILSRPMSQSEIVAISSD